MRSVASFVLVLLLSCVDVALAQQVTGNLIGTVKDETGALLPGVSVTLNSPVLHSTGLTTVTNATGEYRFTGLVAGTYSLRVSLDGFKTYVEERKPRTIGLKRSTVFAFTDGLSSGELDGMTRALGPAWSQKFKDAERVPLNLIASRLPDEEVFFQKMTA